MSPDSLGKSFSSGVAAGQPAASGAQSLSGGAMHAATAPAGPSAAQGQPVVPVAPVVSAPTMAGGAESAQVAHGGQPVAGGAAPVVVSGGASGSVAPAPAVVAGPVGAPAAPIAAAAPAAPPAGPLPAYGADLRPAMPAGGPVVSAPGPVGGAPVVPSAPSVPSAGGSLVSPVDRSGAPGAGAAHGNPNASGVAAAGVASATSGAAAGDAARRLAERQDLQRKVDAVARQEPGFAWAAGARDDGTTTLLVTDLAGGWIPPTVKLPTGVTLLAPAARRSDIGVVDLLGAVVSAAAHAPNGYISEPGQDAPALTGDRVAREVPAIDDFNWTLMEAIRSTAGLPRAAQTLGLAALREWDIPDNDADAFRELVAEAARVVRDAYPTGGGDADGDPVLRWMLLAAVQALVDGHMGLAHYHLSWALVRS
ncbi:MAG: DUF5632 domain-containing protein [Mycolicibacterium sp.]|uniref:DUF5632 domain-containing protein n=2 Tax=Mycolicibacterium sp. TaxID=2320850 RepID=UPI003D0E2FD4